MTETAQLSDGSRESHQNQWNAEVEEYCRARQEGILILKTLGNSELEVRSFSPTIIFHSSCHYRLFQALEAVRVRCRAEEPPPRSEVKQTKTKVGCFQRPKVKG